MNSTGTSLAHTELVTHLIHISSCLQQHLDHSCMTIYSCTIQWCLLHERDDIHNTSTGTLHPYNGFMPSHNITWNYYTRVTVVTNQVASTESLNCIQWSCCTLHLMTWEVAINVSTAFLCPFYTALQSST